MKSYMKILNPDNQDFCYVVSEMSDKHHMIFLDRMFDEKFKVYQTEWDIVDTAKDRDIFVWEFTSLDNEKIQRLIDEIKWTNTKITLDKK